MDKRLFKKPLTVAVYSRGLKYLLKILYFIQNYSNVAGFLIFKTICLGRSKTLSEKITQKWTVFVFGNTYLHQTCTECVSDQHAHFDVLICQIWLQVMERHLILLYFLAIFIHNWRAFMSEVLYLHQSFTDCVSD